MAPSIVIRSTRLAAIDLLRPLRFDGS